MPLQDELPDLPDELPDLVGELPDLPDQPEPERAPGPIGSWFKSLIPSPKGVAKATGKAIGVAGEVADFPAAIGRGMGRQLVDKPQGVSLTPAVVAAYAKAARTTPEIAQTWLETNNVTVADGPEDMPDTLDQRGQAILGAIPFPTDPNAVAQIGRATEQRLSTQQAAALEQQQLAQVPLWARGVVGGARSGGRDLATAALYAGELAAPNPNTEAALVGQSAEAAAQAQAGQEGLGGVNRLAGSVTRNLLPMTITAPMAGGAGAGAILQAGLQQGGSSYQEAIQAGLPHEDARRYAAQQMLAEMGPAAVMSLIPGFGGAEEITSKGLAGGIGALPRQAISENLEETITTWLEQRLEEKIHPGAASQENMDTALAQTVEQTAALVGTSAAPSIAADALAPVRDGMQLRSLANAADADVARQIPGAADRAARESLDPANAQVVAEPLPDLPDAPAGINLQNNRAGNVPAEVAAEPLPELPDLQTQMDEIPHAEIPPNQPGALWQGPKAPPGERVPLEGARLTNAESLRLRAEEARQPEREPVDKGAVTDKYPAVKPEGSTWNVLPSETPAPQEQTPAAVPPSPSPAPSEGTAPAGQRKPGEEGQVTPTEGPDVEQIPGDGIHARIVRRKNGSWAVRIFDTETGGTISESAKIYPAGRRGEAVEWARAQLSGNKRELVSAQKPQPATEPADIAPADKLAEKPVDTPSPAPPKPETVTNDRRRLPVLARPGEAVGPAVPGQEPVGAPAVRAPENDVPRVREPGGEGGSSESGADRERTGSHRVDEPSDDGRPAGEPGGRTGEQRPAGAVPARGPDGERGAEGDGARPRGPGERGPGESIPEDAARPVEPPAPGEPVRGRQEDAPQEQRPVEPTPRAADPAPNHSDWHYDQPADALPPNGDIARAKSNLDAIAALKAVMARAGDPATTDERRAMSRYIGWGGLPWAFKDYGLHAGQEKIAEQLKGALTSDEFEAARASTLNAHFTHPEVVKAMWDMVERMGFSGGRVLEPSMGIGYFKGFIPDNLKNGVRFTGIELDSLTGHMAKYLYPQSTVQVRGFETLKVPDNFYDLAIGNWPFGDYRINEKRYNKLGAYIHDHFFLKTVDLTRPGGIVIGITSTGTMDKKDSSIRDALSKQADLIAAFRLPGKTHDNAGTEVVTDIVILRKRLPGAEPAGHEWTTTGEVPDPGEGENIPLNAYYIANPSHILGRLDRTGTMRFGGMMNVTNTGDFPARLAKAIASLPTDAFQAWKPETKAFEPERLPAPEDVKDSALVAQNGKLYQKINNELVEIKASPERVKRVGAIQGINKALRTLYRAQYEAAPRAEIDAARAELNAVYDAFRKAYGPLNDKKNVNAFKGDPDAPVMLSLEDKAGAEWKKAAVFTTDTIKPNKAVEKSGSVTDALGVSLNERARVDVPHIAKLTGKSEAEVAKHLVENKLAYEDPADGWQIAATYLSGRTRVKLAQAKDAAASDDRFKPNVEALQAAQPVDVPYHQIEPRLGAPWISTDDVANFAAEVTDNYAENFQIGYLPITGGWSVSTSAKNKSGFLAWEVKSEKTGQSKDFIDILDAALSGKVIQFRVTYKDSAGNSVTILDPEASAIAMDKVADLREKFKDWIWKDEERRTRLHRTYNDTMNDNVESVYDGSHLTFPGMNPDPNFQPRPHQRNAAWRILSTGRALLAHEVGSGKTMTMVAAAMELRRTGQAHKPCIGCLNANIQGVVEEARKLYPHAKIITTGGGTMTKEKRQRTMAQIANGDWDMVILTHDNLGMMRMLPETEKRYIAEEMQELREAKTARMAQMEGERQNSRHGRGDRGKGDPTIKQIENALKKLSDRLQKILENGRRDDQVYFEETGIDFLMIDEAHKFKTLPVVSTMDRIKGIPTGRSDRATKMLMFARHVMENNGGSRGVVFATGTPVVNTMVELYTMQKYLQPDVLRERGVFAFDAWARTFGETTTSFEKTVTGDYAPVSRFAKYINMPELRGIASVTMDTVFTEDVPGITLPKRNDSLVKVERSDSQRQFMDWLRLRAANVPKRPEKGDDTILAVAGDGRKAGLDMRLVHPRGEFDPKSKLGQCVAAVLKIHDEDTVADADGKPRHVTQMVFTDVGVHKNAWGFSVVDDLVKRLIEGGIPADKIINFSDLTKTEKRSAVKRLYDGDALIGIGSTETLGTGVNAHQFLGALHNLDVPWNPAYLEQRDGRGVRQGNKNKAVRVNRFVTVATFDQFMWEKVAIKHAFIQSFMRGSGERTMEDHDTEEMTPERIAAESSGDPELMQGLELEQEVRAIQRRQVAHRDEQVRTLDAIKNLTTVSNSERALSEAIAFDLATVEALPDSLSIEGSGYDDREEGAKALQAAIEHTLDELATAGEAAGKKGRIIGTYRGLRIRVQRESTFNSVHATASLAGKASHQFQINADKAIGTLASMEATVRALPRSLEREKEKLAAHEADLAKLKASDTASDFPKSGELKAKREQLSALQKKLKDRVVEKAAIPLADQFVEGWNLRRGREEEGPTLSDIEAETEDVDEDGEPLPVSKIDQDASDAIDSDANLDGPRNGFAEPTDWPRIDPAPMTGGTPKLLSEILKTLEDSLQKSIRVGALPKNVGGRYTLNTGQVKIKHGGDLSIAAHEIGHYLDLAYQIISEWNEPRMRSPYDIELSRFWTYGSKGNGSLAYRRGEGVAEWIRAWMLNPDAAVRTAPKFAAYFQKKVPPNVQDSLQQFGNEVRRYSGMSPIEQGAANIRGIGQGRKSVWAGIKATFANQGYHFQTTWRDRLRAGYTDQLHILEKAMHAAMTMRGLKRAGEEGGVLPSQDPTLTLRLLGGIKDRQESIMERGITDLDGMPLTDGGADHLLNWAVDEGGTSAAEILRRTKMAETIMVAERTLWEAEQLDADANLQIQALLQESAEREVKNLGKKIDAIKYETERKKERLTGIGAGLVGDPTQARRILEDLKTLTPHEQRMIATGMARYRQWSEANLRFWVEAGMISEAQYQRIVRENPFYVDLHRIYADIGKPLMGFEGSTTTIDDPFVNMLAMTEKMQRMAMRNRTFVSFRDLLVADPSEYDGDVPPLDEIGSQMTAEDDDTVKMRVPYTTPEGNQSVRMEYWRFQPDVMKAIEDMSESVEPEGLHRVAVAVARFRRAAIVNTPWFGVRNLFRDAMERTVLSRTGSHPWQSLTPLKPDRVNAFNRAGGGQSDHWLHDKANYDKELLRRVRELSNDQNTVVAGLRWMGRKYHRAIQNSELRGRMAEFESAYAKGKALGYSDAEAELYGASQARGLLDFSIVGAKMKGLTAMTPFLNARIQGMARTIEGIADNPARVFSKWGFWVVAPTMMNYLLNAMQGRDVEKEYWQLPSWRRDLFWNVRVGNGWLSIPKPHELGALASSVDRLIASMRGDTNAFNDYGKQLLLSTLPVDETAIAGPAMPMLELMFNRNSFTGNRIIRDEEKALDVSLRKGKGDASRMGQVIASALPNSGFFAVDPRNVDHFIRSMTGEVGGVAMGLSDLGREDSRNAHWISKLTGLSGHRETWNSRDVADLLDEAEARGESSINPVKAIRDTLRAANKATGEEQTKLMDEALELTRRLQTYFNENPPSRPDSGERTPEGDEHRRLKAIEGTVGSAEAQARTQGHARENRAGITGAVMNKRRAEALNAIRARKRTLELRDMDPGLKAKQLKALDAREEQIRALMAP